MNYKLSPSELTFLYDGCKRCFVLKIKHGIAPPSVPIPSVFSTIANLQKDHYTGKRLEEISPAAPAGVITHGEKRVRSSPVELPGCSSTCYINGRFDIVAELDTGAYLVLDFKTAKPAAEKSAMYSRQLHAYALALEHPESGSLELSPVTGLGLLYFSPDQCEQISSDRQILGGTLEWVGIERDDKAFRDFLGEVVGLLDGPMPEGNPDQCDWCRYRSLTSSLTGRTGNLDGPDGATLVTPTCPKCGGAMRLKSGRHGNFWSCAQYPDCKGTRDA